MTDKKDEEYHRSKRNLIIMTVGAYISLFIMILIVAIAIAVTTR